MKVFRTAITVVACALAFNSFADTREVVQIKYVDGVIDYIPADEISRISFGRGVDLEGTLFSLVDAQFNGLKWIFQLPENNVTHYDLHCDFGYPAIMLGLDSQTEDMISPDTSYNWFRNWSVCRSRTQSAPALLMWVYMYDTILRANAVINGVGDGFSDEDKLLMAQGYALRSWAYWNLVQTFAVNPSVSGSEQAVILLPDDLTSLTADARYPLSSVDEVYAAIMKDIDLAIGLLENNTMHPAHIDVASSKRYIDVAAAYGLRARYNLTCHKYADAAADARKAIELTSATPLQPSAAAFPGFNDCKLGNWMWAITINSTDRAVTSGIVNFPSFMCTLFNGGYVSVGVTRSCGMALHNYLEANADDVRRNWFTDSQGYGQVLTKAQQKVVSQNFSIDCMPWLNIKFDNYQSKILNPSAAADVPLMRVEEMYLIEMEGLAMSGYEVRACDLLNEFVVNYRNPSYSFSSNNGEAIRDEILWQRRAELWGEGLVYFDKLRLQLDIDRYEDENCPEAFKLRIRGNSRWMLYQYPQVRPMVEGLDYESLPGEMPQPGENWND